MNAQAILDVIAKGFTLIEALRIATETASPAIKAIYQLIENHRAGNDITPEELARVEAILDEQLAQFNEPLPDDAQ